MATIKKPNKGFSVGQRIGHWTIIGDYVRVAPYWRIPCRCDCGVEKLVFLHTFIDGGSRSCKACGYKYRKMPPRLEQLTTGI